MVITQRCFVRIAVGLLITLGSGALPSDGKATQTSEPIAVFSIASVDRLMSDVTYLTRAAGRADVGGLVQMLSASFVEDLDRSRPAGVLIVMEEGEPKGVGFLPVPNLAAALTKIEERFAATTEQLGGGVQRLDLGQGVFIKEQGDWVFFSDEARHLARLPVDPVELLDGLNEQYDLSARIFVQNVPLPLRQFAISKMRAAAQAEMEADEMPEDPFEREVAVRIQEHALMAFEQFFRDSDQLTLGWTIDGPGRKTSLELTLTAVQDSELHRQLTRFSDVTSVHTGFLSTDATAKLLMAGSLSEDQRQNVQAILEMLRGKVMTEIQADPDTPPQLREIFQQFADVVEQTAATGEFDLGAAVLLEPRSFRFAGGGQVADGQQLATAFQQLIELARSEPGVPDVQFHAAQHRGVDFHTFSVPIGDEEDDAARQALGDTLSVVVGTGPQSLYLAFGNDCTDLLKTILDASAEGGRQSVAPLNFRVSVKPLLAFLTSVDDDPQLTALASALRDGEEADTLSLTLTPASSGLRFRVEIDEAVLKMLGQASRDD